MTNNRKTPEHIKELRKIRKKLSIQYLKNPLEFLKKMSEEGKAWRDKVREKQKLAA